ncbi:uncharacterized protein Dwil_GK18700 [Drosophila willistoni]|uniref:Uncharacterized protein n=1 Tax=Drosophila willistoni TaxID=7260 RepID=B4N7L8_DROWI|nr:uncharacterized protein LOC6646706 [Drosophila willistoni]EDW80357.1 uncharacterized protein Dwil_GK18700 [Drosophila willistoni]
MEYGNGYMQYQSMEGYGMSSPAEGYNQMGVTQMGGGQPRYYADQSGYGNGLQPQDESRNCQNGSAAFGGPGYRSPLRYSKALKEMNSRNGLYSPMDQQRVSGGRGDYYTLPGLGGNEGQMSYQSHSSGNSYY